MGAPRLYLAQFQLACEHLSRGPPLETSRHQARNVRRRRESVLERG